MGMRHAAVVAGLALGLMSGTAKAAIVIDFTQVGADVDVVGEGTLDTDGLTKGVLTTHLEEVDAVNGRVTLGGTFGEQIQTYRGFTGPASFGTGGVFNPTSTNGDEFSIEGKQGNLFLSPNFISGSSISFAATFADSTFSTLGLTPGTYTYKLPNDTISIDIGGVSSVPLPASAPMFGAALIALGAAGYGLKRKGKAAAAA